MMRDDRPRMAGRGGSSSRARRRRLATPASVAAVIAAVVVLVAGWCGLWYVAAAAADRSLAGWVKREASAGRIYSCGSQGIFGFPFRIQARCVGAGVTLTHYRPPVEVAATGVVFTAELFRPTQLVAEVSGPLTVSAAGAAPRFVANWSHAQMTVTGQPPSPQAVSININKAQLFQVLGAKTARLFAADSAEFAGRVIGGAANNHPVIDAVLQFAGATAPTLHPLLAAPVKGRIEVVIRGLRDLAPKPPAQRLRELQAASGAIEIKSLRMERADAVIVGSGTLTLNAQGQLNGLMRVAVAGVENIVPQLGIDRLIGRDIGRDIGRIAGSSGKPALKLSALDRLLPGLSGIVRQSADLSVIDTIKKMGQPSEIGGKPAVVLPVRLVDGSVYLGMIRIGAVPPLF